MLLSQGVLNILGGAMAALIYSGFGGTPFSVACTLVIGAGLITLLVVARRRSPFSDIPASLIFVANVCPVYLLLWTSQAASATRGLYWTPFEPHGLTCLTIAILAPPVRWIGIPTIVVPPLLATFQHFSFTPDQLQWLPQRPLFAVSAFAAFGVVLYLFRLHDLWLADLAAHSAAEAKMMRKMTNTILAIKDLANSPIQALTLDAETLSRRSPENARLAGRIREASLQLRNLNRILDEYIRQENTDHVKASFDSYEELGMDRPPTRTLTPNQSSES